MPYKDPKQAVAVFLSIQRKKGQAAAKAWGAKHRKDFDPKPYKSRRKRSR